MLFLFRAGFFAGNRNLCGVVEKCSLTQTRLDYARISADKFAGIRPLIRENPCLKIISRYFLCAVIILGSLRIAAAAQEKKYLWIAYPQDEDGGGVRVSQRLFISYGESPDKREDIPGAGQTEVFCTFGEMDEQGTPVYYSLNAESADRFKAVTIKSQKETWCAVFARMVRREGKKECVYTAGTSFFIQGNPRENNGIERCGLDAFTRKLNIELFRERVKEDNTLYRRVGFPLNFTVTFDGMPLNDKDVAIIDESGRIIPGRTDRQGVFSYQPDRQKKFRQDIIVVEHNDNGQLYKTTYSVLFRHSQHVTAKKRDLDLPLGVAIFAAAFFASFAGAVITRKKFEHEDL